MVNRDWEKILREITHDKVATCPVCGKENYKVESSSCKIIWVCQNCGYERNFSENILREKQDLFSHGD